jgi:hypothetical protein
MQGVAAVCVRAEGLQIGEEDQGGDGSAGIGLSSHLEDARF